jgi:signal transduction histidine kinase
LSVVHLPAVLGEILEGMALPANIRVDRQFDQTLPPVALDRDHLGQILWNLVTNAVQAMGVEGGTLTIRTVAANERLQIEVLDTGSGISPADASRIFQPSFTTKPQGVGLGLSIARALARAGGGDLTLAESAGPGARFVLDLPLTTVENRAAS